MNSVMKAVIGVLLLALAGLSVASPPEGFSDTQVKRLADAGRLWATARLFHPWLAEGRIDWDQALIQALPRIKSAGSAEEYRAALDFLLSFLNDPASRITVQRETPANAGSSAAAPAGSPVPPTLRWIKEDLALISIPSPRPSAGPDEPSPLDAIAKDAAKAKAVIFDLRRADKGGHGESPEAGSYDYEEDLESCLLSFVQGEMPMPSTRYRMYVGHPGYGPSNNAIVSKLRRPYLGRASRPYRLVLIVDEDISSTTRWLLMGLQSGIASIILEGARMPEDPWRYTMALSDGLSAELRVGDTVGSDGSLSRIADKVVPPLQDRAPGSDPALEWALQAAEGKISVPVRAKVPWFPPQIVPDEPYADPEYPSEEVRLLGLFRLWSDIQFFSPYRDIMDKPWDGVIEEFVPRIAAARDALDYHLCVAELATRIQDSHCVVNSQVLRRHIGTNWPPLEVKWIEGQSVVTHVFSGKTAERMKITRGDIILGVDGKEVEDRRAFLGRIYPASTPQSLQLKMCQRLLAGPKDSEAKVKVRHADGIIAEYVLKRTMNFPRSQRTTPAFGVLPEGYGYLDLDRLGPGDIDKAFEVVKNTSAAILDIRGNTQAAGSEIARRLAGRKVITAVFEMPEVHGIALDRPSIQRFEQPLEPKGPWRYQGKVVVLINEEAISQSEHACLCLEAAAPVTFVGSPTTGANGMVSSLTYPGGLRIGFTAYGVRHGDGRRLQRVGIQPQITVRPTVQGIRESRDEVLERALSYLKNGK